MRLLLALALLSAPSWAIDARSVEIDYAEHVISIVRTNSQVRTFDWTDRLPLDEADRAFAQSELQVFYDTVIRRNELPVDDPDRLANPNSPCAFWSGPGQSITYRGVLVSVTLDAGGNPFLELFECRR